MGSGTTSKETEEEGKYILMGPSTKAIGKTISLMVKDEESHRVARCMRGNGPLAKFKVRVSSFVKMPLHTQDSG